VPHPAYRLVRPFLYSFSDEKTLALDISWVGAGLPAAPYPDRDHLVMAIVFRQDEPWGVGPSSGLPGRWARAVCRPHRQGPGWDIVPETLHRDLPAPREGDDRDADLCTHLADALRSWRGHESVAAIDVEDHVPEEGCAESPA
jgi:hypothetical protein